MTMIRTIFRMIRFLISIKVSFLYPAVISDDQRKSRSADRLSYYFLLLKRILIPRLAAYGRIVCRCENVTEGEIRDAIRRTPGARSLDGIKRRVRQGMGRCQAGFCTPRTISILAEELGIPEEDICKNIPGSEILCSKEDRSDDQA